MSHRTLNYLRTLSYLRRLEIERQRCDQSSPEYLRIIDEYYLCLEYSIGWQSIQARLRTAASRNADAARAGLPVRRYRVRVTHE